MNLKNTILSTILVVISLMMFTTTKTNAQSISNGGLSVYPTNYALPWVLDSSSEVDTSDSCTTAAWALNTIQVHQHLYNLEMYFIEKKETYDDVSGYAVTYPQVP